MSKDLQSFPKTVSEWPIKDSLLLFSNSFKCLNTQAMVQAEFVWGCQKVLSHFSLTSYRKIQMNFLANPIGHPPPRKAAWVLKALISPTPQQNMRRLLKALKNIACFPSYFHVKFATMEVVLLNNKSVVKVSVVWTTESSFFSCWKMQQLLGDNSLNPKIWPYMLARCKEYPNYKVKRLIFGWIVENRPNLACCLVYNLFYWNTAVLNHLNFISGCFHN